MSIIPAFIVDRIRSAKIFINEYRFIHCRTFKKIQHINCSNEPLADKNILDIITIAFNNNKVIKQQSRLLNKYLSDPFHYTVADNSSDLSKSGNIKKLCRQLGIAYIRLPENPFSRINPSLSHGVALNWVYRNYVCSRKPAYFGFIDHDIFPVRPSEMIANLNASNIYGHLQERDDIWYLWPGFCFFSSSFVNNKRLNFMPGKGYDTGGGNWKSVYSKLDKKRIPFPDHEYGKLKDGRDPQSDMFERMGDWIHTFNASQWKKTSAKDDLIDKLLNKY